MGILKEIVEGHSNEDFFSYAALSYAESLAQDNSTTDADLATSCLNIIKALSIRDVTNDTGQNGDTQQVEHKIEKIVSCKTLSQLATLLGMDVDRLMAAALGNKFN